MIPASPAKDTSEPTNPTPATNVWLKAFGIAYLSVAVVHLGLYGMGHDPQVMDSAEQPMKKAEPMAESIADRFYRDARWLNPAEPR